MSIKKNNSLILNEIKTHYSFKSNAEFAAFLGIAPQTLSSWYSRNSIDYELLYAKCVDVDANWLLTGEGDMLRKNDLQQLSFSVSEFKQKGYAPYYSEMLVSAGQYDLATIIQIEEPESWIKMPGLTVDGWFPIIGCSMEPKVYAGDTIGVTQIDNWEKLDPDKIYLIITHDDRMIKHLEVDEANPNILWAVSENYKRFKIPTEDIIRIFRVVFAGKFI
jgi:phage repressor protein C with HTH and peptisase S24 domain